MKTNKKYQELNAENIQRLLHTKFIGKETIYLREIDSTNQYGLKLLKGNVVSNGTLIVANYQISGRGRHGKKWMVPRGKGLLFSIVFTDINQEEMLPLLTFAGAISVADTIMYTFPKLKPTIRWPNDILLQGKKVAGILVETSSQKLNNRNSGAVIGIGVNVNQSKKDFSGELGTSAASLFMFTGKRVLRLEFLIPLLENMEKLYLLLNKGSKSQIWTRFRRHSSTLGKGVRLKTPAGRIIEGTASDIDEDGGLLVRMDGGNIIKFCSGDVEEVEWIQ